MNILDDILTNCKFAQDGADRILDDHVKIASYNRQIEAVTEEFLQKLQAYEEHVLVQEFEELSQELINLHTVRDSIISQVFTVRGMAILMQLEQEISLLGN